MIKTFQGSVIPTVKKVFVLAVAGAFHWGYGYLNFCNYSYYLVFGGRGHTTIEGFISVNWIFEFLIL